MGGCLKIDWWQMRIRKDNFIKKHNLSSLSLHHQPHFIILHQICPRLQCTKTLFSRKKLSADEDKFSKLSLLIFVLPPVLFETEIDVFAGTWERERRTKHLSTKLSNKPRMEKIEVFPRRKLFAWRMSLIHRRERICEVKWNLDGDWELN